MTKVRIALAFALLAACTPSGPTPEQRTEISTLAGSLTAHATAVLDLCRVRYRAGVDPGCTEKIDVERLQDNLRYRLKSAKIDPRPLDEYWIVWTTALSGIEPTFNERAVGYDARQAGLTDRLNEAAARLQTEFRG